MKNISNKKGFTIVELLTSFALAMVVMVFIFNIVLSLKNSYIFNATKSELVLNQSLLSTELNSDFEAGKILSFEPCGASTTNCYTIKMLVIDEEKTKTLNIDVESNKIKYGTYNYVLDDSESIGAITICKNQTNASGRMNSYLIIEIPITSTIVTKGDFGVKVIYPYNDDGTVVNNIDNC